MNVRDVEHWVRIIIRTKLGGDLIESFSWQGMTFEQRTKWDWYFKYRAALAQVKHPRAYVDFRWGNEPARDRAKANNEKNKLRAAKAQVTKWKNKLAAYERDWTSMFPIEDDPIYQKAVCKIRAKEQQLKKITNKMPK